MAEIRVENLHKSFGDFTAVKSSNLIVGNGEFFVLLGPSGCGKTTTLRMIAGLELPTSGRILLDGEDVAFRRARERDIAFVFQLFALYPHLTAFDNIAFPLRATGESRAEIERKVRDVAASLRIEPLLGKRPSALSGGDLQRVAIGRALVRRPKALLMDEPIGALDAKLREDMRAELKRLHLENGTTSVYVTHDQVEAMSLADRVAVMNDGVLQQVGTPSEVYLEPVNLFVAQFVGSPVMNVVPAEIRVEGGETAVSIGGGPAFAFPGELAPRLGAALPAGHEVVVGVRPEAVEVAREGGPGLRAVEAHFIEPLGSHDIVDLKVGERLIKARTPSGFVKAPGEGVWARLDVGQVHFFDATTGNVLDLGPARG